MSGSKPGISLRAQLVVAFGLLVTFVVVVVASIFIYKQMQDRTSEIANQRATQRELIKKRAEAVVRNIALSSERAVAVLDFLFLTEVLNHTIKNDPDFVYGSITDANGTAIVDTRQDHVGQVATAAVPSAVTTRDITLNGGAGLETSAPIVVNSKPWGTISVGLSLAGAEKQIVAAEHEIQRRFDGAIVTSILLAVILAAFGSLLAALVARRLVQPLGTLLDGVRQIGDGRLDHQIEAQGASEFFTLATAFNQMTGGLNERDLALRENNSKLRVALQKAEEASRLKSEFLSNVSHELRTPLNSIVNVPVALLKRFENRPAWHCKSCDDDYVFEGEDAPAADAVQSCPTCGAPLESTMRLEMGGDPAEHRHFLQMLRQSAQHLLSVVNDLLDFSKLEAGRMRLHCEDLELGVLFGEVAETVSTLALEKKVHFEHPLSSPITVYADRVKVSQVLINLIGNAIKFTPEQGRITLGVTEEQIDAETWLRFSVTDTGIGIPKEHLETIFESFRQVDGGHTRQHGGTGLGLAITRQLVELHGGRVWAESTVGQGSTFTVLLPARARAPVPRPDAGDADGDKPQIMVIDDSHAQLELTKLVLEQEGYETHLVEYSTEALQRVRERKPRAIILDVMMPEVSGLAILRQLKAAPETRDIPVLVASAYHQNKDLVQGLGGIWLPKPWDSDELLRRIQMHLATKDRA